MQRKWKRRWQRLTKAILPPVAAGLLLLSAYRPALANPTGGTVTSGSAAITGSGSIMTVNQTTNKAVINWQSFSIGKGETVNFVQPGAGSVALNRVIGSDASAIYGSLNANGKVYLINPNGILFSSGAQVNVGGLVASTLNISDSDFVSGKYIFQKDGSAGSVVNKGTITATNEVVLIGPKVANEGIIAAKVTGLAAGNKVRLDFNGDSLLNVAVNTSALNGSATNCGTITAAGGLVVMNAGTKDALLGTVINNSGVIRAQSVNNAGGVIRLEGNIVVSSGTLDASGKAYRQTGGTVKVLGDTITLASGSSIDVSGDAGGGTALIGGARQGGASEYAATATTVGKDVTINADAITTGNGGNIVVWSNGTTNFAGTITARGGAASGNGGSVEVSGKQMLEYKGHTDTTAVAGKTGSLLLDPGELTISTGVTTGNVKNVNELIDELSDNNVTLATDSTGSGDITVSAAITWGSDTDLTLSAYRHINILKSITNTGNGNVTLRADSQGTGTGTVNIAGNPTSGGKINLIGGTATIYYSPNYASSIISANDDIYNVKVTAAKRNYIMQVNNLALLKLIYTKPACNYLLTRDIDADSSNFTPIGKDKVPFSGVFDGGGHTISGLRIGYPANCIGMFGISSGTIRNLKLVDVNVSGISTVGGLVGLNLGTITNCSTTGTVSGGHAVGGLAGSHGNSGRITNSYSTAAVESTADESAVGGLVGYNYNGGYIAYSFSTGNVEGKNSVGGLVGENAASSIENCYSTGTVNGVSYVGGLVGNNNGGRIANSYSTGAVSASLQYAGGLAGYSQKKSAIITDSYSTGRVTGNQYVGGLVGVNGSTIQDSYWDIDTSGRNWAVGGGKASGAVGLRTWEWQTKGPIVTGAFDTTTAWVAGDYVHPVLKAFPYIVITGSVSQVYGAAPSSVSIAGVTDQTGADATSKVNTSSLTWLTDTAHNAGSKYITGGAGAMVDPGYQLTYIGTVDVTQRPITVTTGNASRVYGVINPTSGTISITSGKLAGTDEIKGSASVTSTATTASNVGDYTLTPTGVVFTKGSADNYSITYVNGTLTITPRPITVTVVTSKVYGEANPTSAAAILCNDRLVGSDALGSASVTSDATAASSVGHYNLTPSGVTFTKGSADNYSISYSSGTLRVTPRPITVTADSTSRVYGDANPASGTISVTSGSLAVTDAISDSAGVSSTATTTSNVGDYALTPTGVTFTKGSADNYSITYSNGTLTVTPRPITVTAGNASKVYGDANPASAAVSVTGGSLAVTDAISDSTGVSSTATTASNVGDYALTLTGVAFTKGSADNYNITYANGILTVTPRPITVTANSVSRVYGGANSGSGIVSVTSGSLAGTDAISANAGVSSSATTTSNVGDYALTPSNVVFTKGSADNYSITYANGTLTVTPRPITVTAGNASRVYGDANPCSGIVSVTSGSLAGTDAINTNAGVSSSATTASNVGDYTLTSSGVNFTSGSASNYNISYANGTLTITPRPITVTANNASKVYGEANPASGAVTLTAGSLAGSDALGTASLSSTATTASNVGDYTLTPSGVNFTSGSASNYNVSYANGTLTITPRNITLTANNASKVYGEANPASGAVTLTAGSLAVSDALGTASLSSTATTTSSLGDYTLTPNGVNFTSGSASNYNITYVNGTLTITPRPITVTANTSKVYGEANPANGAVTLTAGSLAVSDALGTASLSTTATITSSVGDYTLTPSGVNFTSGSASNYNISYANGTLNITPRPITVTANNASKFYGETNPANGAVTLTAGSLAVSDALGTASLSTTATTTSSVGDYTLTPNGVNFTSGSASNYNISYANGTLTISKASLTVTANNVAKYSGQTNPAFTASYSGLGAGDTPASLTGSLTFDTAATTVSGPGTYAITLTGTLSSPNYNVSYADGVLTVRPVTNPAYTGAVGTALAGASVGTDPNGYWGLGSGFNGLSGGALGALYTIDSPGINLTGLGQRSQN